MKPTANLRDVIRAHEERTERAISAIVAEYDHLLLADRLRAMAREIYRQRLALCELLVDPTEEPCPDGPGQT